MPELRLSVGLAGGGDTISRAVTRTVEGANSRKVTLPAAKTGNLTTRTDDNTGTLTMDADHGIQTGDIIDIYWDGGVQYNVVVGTVSVNSVPFDSGVGDNLPADESEITASVQVEVETAIDGDALDSISVDFYQAGNGTGKGHVDFQESDSTSIAPLDLDAAGAPLIWDITGGADNPFTGDPIAKAMASNGDSTAAATLKIIWGGDSTP